LSLKILRRTKCASLDAVSEIQDEVSGLDLWCVSDFVLFGEFDRNLADNLSLLQRVENRGSKRGGKLDGSGRRTILGNCQSWKMHKMLSLDWKMGLKITFHFSEGQNSGVKFLVSKKCRDCFEIARKSG
jgi:hypothetical protein